MLRGRIWKKIAAALAGILIAAFVIGCSGLSGSDGKQTAEVTSEVVSERASETPTSVEATDEATEGQSDEAGSRGTEGETPAAETSAPDEPAEFDISKIPAFSGVPYVIVNDNRPFFARSEYTTTSFEDYSDLDGLGRCGVASACIGRDLMPTEERGSIGSVKPTGWHTVKYDCVDGKYLYNRCHLIGFQLSGENANKKNLVTGTRYLNVDGMLPFENMVADYVKETGNHVLYRVTPVFEGDNLLCTGVLMEAYSVEDKGDGVEFCVFAYNAQPGVVIDYATGDSCLGESGTTEGVTAGTMAVSSTETSDSGITYVYSKNSKTFHVSSCYHVNDIKTENKRTFTGNRQDLIDKGFKPCKDCNP